MVSNQATNDIQLPDQSFKDGEDDDSFVCAFCLSGGVDVVSGLCGACICLECAEEAAEELRKDQNVVEFRGKT